MQLRFSVYNSFADLPIEWRNHCSNKTSCNGIDVDEKSNLSDLKHLYVVVFSEEMPVFITYYQLLSVKPHHFNISHRKIQQKALSLALKLVKPKLLVAGNLFRHDMVFYFFVKADLSIKEQQDIYFATNEYLIQYTNCSGIFLKDVSLDMAIKIADDDSFMQMPEDVSMEISLPPSWKSFDDYEKELKHKYLQRCKKVRKSFVEIEKKEFSLLLIEQYAIDMETLYAQVTQKQLVSMGKINHAYFVEMKKSLQEKYKVFGFFKDEKLIAFSSAIIHNDDYDMNYIGFDYAFNQSHSLYFNILFHCLDSAIEVGSKKLILGRTALEAKAILGCEPDYRNSYYKLRNVIVNWFYKLVASYFREAQGEKWKDRHPFKSGFYEKTAED
jgi:hypothetical protein